MRPSIPILVFLALCSACASSASAPPAPTTGAAASGGMQVLNPGDLHWKPKDALPPGAFGATLRGDPHAGDYDFVGKFPAKYTVPLHYHSNDCYVVMLKSAMVISRPGQADVEIAEGGYFSLPARMQYTAHCEAECTFLVQGEKPFDIIYADQRDDPRVKR
jgi:hypothetical protein